jgi:hypothetical protein
MPGLDPGIHVFLLRLGDKVVDGRHRLAEATPFFERLCPTMTSPFARDLDSKHTLTFPRRVTPGLCFISFPQKQRAQGMPGARPHPQPRMRNKKHTSVVTAGEPEAIRHSLHDGFNGFLRARPGDRAFCLRRQRNAQALSPA